MSIKISELPSATSVGAGDYIPIVQGGVTKKATSSMIGGEYTQLEYIESTGTQYIDTGIAQDGFHFIGEMIFTDFSSLQMITGTYGLTQGGSGQDSKRYYLRVDSGGTINTQFGGTSGNNKITGNTLSINTKYKIEAKLFNGSQQLKVNDINYGEQTIASQTFPNTNIPLLCVRDMINNTYGNFTIGRLYNAKYYNNNGTMVRDFIPVIKNTTGEVGLLDKVNGVFYGNSGTGKFLYAQYTENYSTTEQRVGTWIDGKPLYEITYSNITNAQCATDGTGVNLQIGTLQNIDTIFVKFAFSKLTTSSVGSTITQITSMSSANATYNTRAIIGYRSDSKEAKLYLNNAATVLNNALCTITYNYTKTTDTRSINLTKGISGDEELLKEDETLEEKKELEEEKREIIEPVEENNEVKESEPIEEKGEEYAGEEPIEEK